MRRVILAAILVPLGGCADSEVRDQASAAEERANSAYSRVDELEQTVDDLENRIADLEAAQEY